MNQPRQRESSSASRGDHPFIPLRAKLAAGLTWLSLLVVSSAQAWGPHSEITQAALDALGTNNALVVHLGAHAQRLTNTCWMGDFFGVIVEDPAELFFADDYLLFPEAPSYFSHIGAEIQSAFRPFFGRTVRALRTENPANAARWIGSLLHFVQDAGCPPHAAGLRGTLHSNMENWVETNQIRIADYRPRALGATEAEALQGLLREMDEWIPQAEERGRRLRLPVEIGNRNAVKAPMLESALDSARLTADLLHTLGQFTSGETRGTAALVGTVSGQVPVGLERFPAKVVVQGKPFSTLADLAGRFEFRQLPPGEYTVVAYRPGNGMAQRTLSLAAGQTNTCDLRLPAQPNTLVPNGDFKLSWMRPGIPDYWYPTKSSWECEPILLRPGQRYRLAAHLKAGSQSAVTVRWMGSVKHALPRFKIEPRFKSRTLTAKNSEMVLTGGPDVGLLHLTIRGRAAPATVFEIITLVPVPDAE